MPCSCFITVQLTADGKTKGAMMEKPHGENHNNENLILRTQSHLPIATMPTSSSSHLYLMIVPSPYKRGRRWVQCCCRYACCRVILPKTTRLRRVAAGAICVAHWRRGLLRGLLAGLGSVGSCSHGRPSTGSATTSAAALCPTIPAG